MAPESQIKKGIFSNFLKYENINQIVSQRVSEYDNPEKNKWLTEWFKPTLEKIHIREIPWEELIMLINEHDAVFGKQLNEFYKKCKEFGRNTN